MKKSTHVPAPSVTPAPASTSADPLAVAQSALTAAGEQYAASFDLSPAARQDLLGQVIDQAGAVENLTGGTE